MEKRLLLAFAISFLVYFAFQTFFLPHKKAPMVQKTAPVQDVHSEVVMQEYNINGPINIQGPASGLVDQQEKTTTIETDKFIIGFSNLGGSITRVVSKEYDTVLADNLSPESAMFSILSSNLGKNLNQLAFDVKEEGNRVTYSYHDPESDIRLVKEFSVNEDENYIKASIEIENLSEKSIYVDYDIIGPSRMKAVSSLKGRNFIEGDVFLDGKLIKRTRIKEGREIFKGTIGWVAMKNRYFAIAMQPPREVDAAFAQQRDKKISMGVSVSQRAINSGMTLRDDYTFYLGPIQKEQLAKMNIGLEKLVYYGWFGGISAFLLGVLRAIASVVHNWGVTIIIMTIIINIALFPLTKKSFLSMQKVQELQPHMEKLKSIHKDNPQKVQKEMMVLYKQNKVNPFGGCLPMLLQLPVFVSFYQALMRSIELKNASFLWIKDLSGPDALFTFSKPLPLVGWETFNLLPLLTVVVMFFQQKITSAHAGKQMSEEMRQQQKIMTTFMPVFFGFILYNFPSGLVLYWLTNSLLMTGEQYMMRKKVIA